MVKKQLTIDERIEIQKKLVAGIRPSVLAKKYEVSHRTIKRIRDADDLERKKYDSTNLKKINAQDEVHISDIIEKEDNKLTSIKMMMIHNRNQLIQIPQKIQIYLLK